MSSFTSPYEQSLSYEEIDGDILLARLESRDESLVLNNRSRVRIGNNLDKPLSFLATFERHDLLDSAIAALVRGCEEGRDASWLREEVASCLFLTSDLSNLEFVDALLTTSDAALGIIGIKTLHNTKPIEEIYKGDWSCAGKTVLHLAADSKGRMLELVEMLFHSHAEQCRAVMESLLDGNGRSVLELAKIALGLAEKEKSEAYSLAQGQKKKKEEAEADVAAIEAIFAGGGRFDAQFSEAIIAKLNELEKAQLACTPSNNNDIELFRQVLTARAKKEVSRLKEADKNFQKASRRLPRAEALAKLIHSFAASGEEAATTPSLFVPLTPLEAAEISKADKLSSREAGPLIKRKMETERAALLRRELEDEEAVGVKVIFIHAKDCTWTNHFYVSAARTIRARSRSSSTGAAACSCLLPYEPMPVGFKGTKLQSWVQYLVDRLKDTQGGGGGGGGGGGAGSGGGVDDLCILVGHSTGANAALRFAEQHPVHSLVLLGAAYTAQDLKDDVAAREAAALREAETGHKDDPSIALETQIVPFDIPAILSNVHHKILLVHGVDDNVVPVHGARDLADAFHGAIATANASATACATAASTTTRMPIFEYLEQPIGYGHAMEKECPIVVDSVLSLLQLKDEDE